MSGAWRSRRVLLGCVLLGSVLLAAGCPTETPPPDPPPAADAPSPFTDVTREAGLRFVHTHGATARRYLPETMGAGVAFFDFDGDGWPDLYFVNGLPIEAMGAKNAETPTGTLYRNRGDGTFEDVTAGSGLDVPFLGMGVAVGEVDGDGHLDLYVTGVGGDRWFRNRGDGKFEDVSRAWGTAAPGFGSSAAFLDFDRDGRLDLFAGRYVVWSPETDRRCSPDGTHHTYCTPEAYRAEPNRLLHNRAGREGIGFADVTEQAGVGEPSGKSLGVVPLDHDRDGWPDLAIANDTTPNVLWVNQRDGTFRDLAATAGMAVAESGAARGGMGIDAGDLDGDGDCDLVVGNFAFEMAALYRASPAGVFTDDAARAEIGLPTLSTLAFGTLLFDQNGDGWLDLLFANGHIEPDIARFRPGQSYAQPLQLFRSRGGEKGYDAVGDEGGEGGEGGLEPWQGPWVGRGLAVADYDRDGDLDVVLTQNGGPARLLRNEAPDHAWLRLHLRGTRSNRFGYGAEVTAEVTGEAGDRRITRQLVSGRSYLSASEPVLTFGLGDLDEDAKIDRLEVRWPSGTVQVLTDVATRQELTLTEEPTGEPEE